VVDEDFGLKPALAVHYRNLVRASNERLFKREPVIQRFNQLRLAKLLSFFSGAAGVGRYRARDSRNGRRYISPTVRVLPKSVFSRVA
jgi:hypothetical protein